MNRLVIIGGGAAGMSAASAARRVDPDLEIIVVEATGYAAWGLCGIPYLVSGLVAQPNDLVSVSPDDFRTKRRIDLRLHTRAVSVDADGHTVLIRGEGGDEHLSYSRLVVAAGASPAVPPIPGLSQPSVFAVRTLEDAVALRDSIGEGRLRRVLVVGAGYIGLEMADALVERGCEVTVVERLDRVMPNLDADVASIVEAEVAGRVDLRLSTGLVELAGAAARFDDGSTVAVDGVVLAVGIRPAGGLAASAGAEVTTDGALVVDDRMRTSLPDILAAGDCVAVHHIVLGRPAHIALGPTANKTGRVAGMVAAGSDTRFAGIVGTAVAKVFDLTVARTGLTLDESVAAGIDAVAVDSVAGSRAKYYPGAVPTRTRLVHEPSGRLLGAQMVSADPATAKRIDVIATALHAGFDIAALADLDLSYAPPYSPVYDPVLRAAQAAAKAVA